MPGRRRTKRTMPRVKKNTNGLNPLLIAGGAAVGAAAGRALNRRAARSSVSNEVGRMARAGAALKSWDMTMGSGPKDYMGKAASEVHSREYSKMKRAPQAKVDVYKRIVEDQYNGGKRVDWRGSQKISGLSNADLKKFEAKRSAKYGGSLTLHSVKGVMENASELRARRTSGRAARRGAVAGGLSAAAIQMIAAEVAKALKKK